MSRKLVLGTLAVVLAAGLVAGCATVRRIDYGEASESALAEGRPSGNIPQWALGNLMGDPMLDHNMYAYFVGVSQESCTSEYQAVQQAYLDALSRLTDAVAVHVQGAAEMSSGADAETEADWPHQIRRGHKTREYDSESEGAWQDEAKNQAMRDAIVAMAGIADRWVVRDVGQQKEPILNMMKYEELWKAKVLLCVPREELARRMERVYQLQNDKIDWEAMVAEMEFKLDFNQRKREADLDFTTRQKNAELDHEIRRDNAKLDWAIRKAEAEDRLTPEVVPQPTFNFMNNSYWYGYGPGAATKAGVPRVKIDVPK